MRAKGLFLSKISSYMGDGLNIDQKLTSNLAELLDSALLNFIMDNLLPNQITFKSLTFKSSAGSYRFRGNINSSLGVGFSLTEKPDYQDTLTYTAEANPKLRELISDLTSVLPLLEYKCDDVFKAITSQPNSFIKPLHLFTLVAKYRSSFVGSETIRSRMIDKYYNEKVTSIFTDDLSLTDLSYQVLCSLLTQLCSNLTYNSAEETLLTEADSKTYLDNKTISRVKSDDVKQRDKGAGDVTLETSILLGLKHGFGPHADYKLNNSEALLRTLVISCFQLYERFIELGPDRRKKWNIKEASGLLNKLFDEMVKVPEANKQVVNRFILSDIKCNSTNLFIYTAAIALIDVFMSHGNTIIKEELMQLCDNVVFACPHNGRQKQIISNSLKDTLTYIYLGITNGRAALRMDKLFQYLALSTDRKAVFDFLVAGVSSVSTFKPYLTPII